MSESMYAADAGRDEMYLTMLGDFAEMLALFAGDALPKRQLGEQIPGWTRRIRNSTGFKRVVDAGVALTHVADHLRRNMTVPAQKAWTDFTASYIPGVPEAAERCPWYAAFVSGPEEASVGDYTDSVAEDAIGDIIALMTRDRARDLVAFLVKYPPDAKGPALPASRILPAVPQLAI